MTKLDLKPLTDWAWDLYQGVAHDLPPDGRGHYDAALDFLGDRLSDEFDRKYPELVGSFSKVAKLALKGVYNDRKEARAYERKCERAWAARAAAKYKASLPKPEPKAKAPKVRVRRGVGSY